MVFIKFLTVSLSLFLASERFIKHIRITNHVVAVIFTQRKTHSGNQTISSCRIDLLNNSYTFLSLIGSRTHQFLLDVSLCIVESVLTRKCSITFIFFGRPHSVGVWRFQEGHCLPLVVGLRYHKVT